MKLAPLAWILFAASTVAQSTLPCSLATAKVAGDGVWLTFRPHTDWLVLGDGKSNSGLVGDGMVYREVRDGREIKGDPEAEAGFWLGMGRTLELSTHHQGCKLTLETQNGAPVLRSEYGSHMPTGDARVSHQVLEIKRY